MYIDDTNISDEDSALVDYVEANIKLNDTHYIYVRSYASDRGYNDSVYVDEYKDEVTLLGRTYSEVFYRAFDQATLANNPDIVFTELYYSKSVGIVAFRTKDDGYWVLK